MTRTYGAAFPKLVRASLVIVGSVILGAFQFFPERSHSSLADDLLGLVLLGIPMALPFFLAARDRTVDAFPGPWLGLAVFGTLSTIGLYALLMAELRKGSSTAGMTLLLAFPLNWIPWVLIMVTAHTRQDRVSDR